MQLKINLSKKISRIIVFGSGPINFFLTRVFKYFFKNKKSISEVNELIVYLKYKEIVCKLYLDKKSYIDKKIIKDGVHSKYILDEIVNNIQPNSTFIDVGANIGSISIPLAIYFKNQGLKVLACEASSLMHDKLLKNIALNSLQNIISINMAIFKNDKGVSFYEQTNLNLNQGLSSLNKNFDIGDHLLKKIDSTTIDKIINSSEDLDSISVIKIDTQGSELDVLFGASETINRDRPIIIFEHEDEYHDEPIDIKSEIKTFFDQKQYQLFVLSPHLEGYLVPIDLSGYVNTNIVAIPY
jgi:FkbM family methyltransferase